MIQRKPKVKTIIAICAEAHGVTPSQVRGPAKFSEMVNARHEAMFLIRGMRGDSHEQIGRAFNWRHHTTSMYGVKRVSKQIKTDKKTAERLISIAAALRCPVVLGRLG